MSYITRFTAIVATVTPNVVPSGNWPVTEERFTTALARSRDWFFKHPNWKNPSCLPTWRKSTQVAPEVEDTKSLPEPYPTPRFARLLEQIKNHKPQGRKSSQKFDAVCTLDVDAPTLWSGCPGHATRHDVAAKGDINRPAPSLKRRLSK